MTKKDKANFLIKKISEQVDKKFNQDLKCYNLTCSQMRAMIFIAEHGEKTVTQKDLEKFLSVAHPTAVGILTGLTDKGFVECAFDGSDKRMKNVYLTEAGISLMKETKHRCSAVGDDIMGGLSEEELDTLISILQKIGVNFR